MASSFEAGAEMPRAMLSGFKRSLICKGKNLLFSNYTIVSRSASVSARVARFGENAEAEPAATPM